MPVLDGKIISPSVYQDVMEEINFLPPKLFTKTKYVNVCMSLLNSNLVFF